MIMLKRIALVLSFALPIAAQDPLTHAQHLAAAGALYSLAEARAEQAEAQVTTLTAALAARTAELNAANAQITTLQGQVTTLSGQVSALTTQNNALTSQVASLNTQLAAANAEIARLTALLNPPPSAQIVTLFNQAVPTVPDYGDPGAYELGVKWRSSVNGTLKGVRFYKSTANAGAHVGHVWTDSGSMLQAVTFSAETSSGWQEGLFPVAVPIQAGDRMVASVHMPSGHYSATVGGFNSAVTVGPLTAVAASESPNGVYKSGASGFPASSNAGHSNYWVDVIFVPEPGTTPPPPPNPIGVRWDAPTTNVDGTPCDDLGGFIVAFGPTPNASDLIESINVGTATTATLLAPIGKSYVMVRAYDEVPNYSAWSAPLLITIASP
jgi:hypothetical protein